MNGTIIKIDKDLCQAGAELERDWSKAVNEVRAYQLEEKRMRANKKIYDAMRSYFVHRRNCNICRVYFRFEV